MSMDAGPLGEGRRGGPAQLPPPHRGCVSRCIMDTVRRGQTKADDKDRWLETQVEGWAAGRSL